MEIYNGGNTSQENACQNEYIFRFNLMFFEEKKNRYDVARVQNSIAFLSLKV